MRARSTGRRLTVAAVAAALVASGAALGLSAAPAATAAAAPAPLATRIAGTVNRSDRAAVLAAFQARYVVPSRVSATWTGSVASCRAGSTSAAFTNATLTAINWARGQAGMPPVLGVNATYSARAQRTALLMQAAGAVSHAPPSSWACWSAAAAAGAAHSDLALGVAGARAVGMYLVEPGAANVGAGHRRWLLYPRLGQIGIGNTTVANAVYVIGSATRLPAGVPAYYAWPTSGYFPRAAEPRGLWSLSSSQGYSFAHAAVRVAGPGGAVLRLTRYAPQAGFGDSTLVWRLSSPPGRTIRTDQTYRVTVTGIRATSGAITSYSYQVTLVS